MTADTCVYTFRDGRRCTNRIKDSGHCSKHVKVFRLRRAERGEWIIGQPVDATLVKRHLRRLHEAGIGTRRIAELTGITSVTVRVIRNKDQERVHPNTAARILAVPLPDVPHADCVADSALIIMLYPDETGKRAAAHLDSAATRSGEEKPDLDMCLARGLASK